MDAGLARLLEPAPADDLWRGDPWSEEAPGPDGE